MVSKINGPLRLTGAVAALLLSLLPARGAHAQSCGALPCSFEGTPVIASNSNLNSTSDFMIAYRDEQHSWQTPDGQTHFLVNTGSGPGRGLQIWTRYVDQSNNVTWVAGPVLPGTASSYNPSNPNPFAASSTSDGRLVTSGGFTTLSVVYTTTLTGTDPGTYSGGNVAYMQLDYSPTSANATTTGWSLDFSVSHSVALTDVYDVQPGYYAVNPTLAIDNTNAGTIWTAFTLTQCPYYNSSSPSTSNCQPTTTIKLTYLGRVNNNSKWIDSGLNFGPTDGNYVSEERSARLIATSNAVGMIYQVHQSYFWTYRINGTQPNSAWSAPQPFFTSAPNPGTTDPAALYDNNPYASHFSALPDSDNPAYVPGGSEAKIHMVTVDHSRLLYLGYGASQTGGWANPSILMTSTEGIGTPNQKTGASYPQIFFAPKMNSGSKQYLGALVNNSTVGNLFQSTDNGATWTGVAVLRHDNAAGTASFLNPRFEIPQAINTADVPLVQQYVDSSASPYDNELLDFDLTGLIN